MKLRNLIAIIVIVLTGFNLSFSQWSQDPSEALQMPEGYGGVLVTDSLGGVFIVGAEWDYSRTYCTYLNRDGEHYWDEWVALMPEVDIDRASDPFVCPEPGYLATVLFVEHHTDEDTLWEIRAQKVNLEGELVWPDSGVSVSSTRLWDAVTYTDMIGAVGDGEGGLIIVWAMKYYRLVGNVDRVLERQSFHAQRVSSDGEALWGDNGVELLPDVEGTANTHLISGKLVSDGAGGVIMVYHQGGIQVRIIGGQRISLDGEKLWGDSGVLNELNSYLIIGEAVSDNHGGVIFSGQAAQEERRHVRVFRFDQDGNQLFGDGNGVVVKDVHYRDGGYLHNNWITQASDSVFFVHWKGDGDEEPRSLVQAVNLEGELIWEWPGLTVCDADTIGHTMRGVSSINSVIYGWMGYRPSEERDGALYCQRLDEQGNRMWADEGVMLYDRRGISISYGITDCYGGAIFKIGSYLQHINRNGELGVPLTIRGFDQPLAPGMIEYSIFPNPTNSSTTLQFSNPLFKSTTLKIYDLQGRLVYLSQVNAGVWSQVVDVAAFPAGSYVIEAGNIPQILRVLK